MKRNIGLGLGAIAVVAGIFLLMFQLLPPIVPAHGVVVASRAPERRRRATTTLHQHTAKPGTAGFESVNYSFLGAHLDQESHKLHITVYVPIKAFPNTVLQESYVSGTTLTLQYNNMIIMESPDPIASYYRPDSTQSTLLESGVSAEWEWIPGEGGPAHRLLFEMGSTYIRLQLSSPQVQDTMANAIHVADEFHALGA